MPRPKVARPAPEAADAPPAVLVVHPDQAARRAVAAALNGLGTVQASATGAAALKRLRRNPPAVVIAAPRLADMTGPAFCARVHRAASQTKTLVLAEPESLPTLVAHPDHGFIDRFATLPLQPKELLGAVEKLCRQHTAERERARLAAENEAMVAELRRLNTDLGREVRERTRQFKQANRELKRVLRELEAKNRALLLLNESLNIQATVDPLTGLYNRREFHRRLQVEWARVKRGQGDLALVMLDIDHFKVINDTHGHPCGDLVLRTLGRVLSAQLRRQDLVCRYGGEEFVVLLPDTKLASAFLVAESLRHRVAAHGFRCTAERIPVAISLGVASARQHHPADPDGLVACADQAMYRAKAEGRNRSVVLDPKHPERVARMGAD